MGLAVRVGWNSLLSSRTRGVKWMGDGLSSRIMW
nr:MAG TPA: hypothetical protein [Caudoviricetes sp.]